MVERLHAIVSGRVQGVFYRATARERGRELGLAGWVRNLQDGRVETLAEGPREALQLYLDFLWMGPPAARVDAVAVGYEQARGDLEGFEVLR
jgi:acylphosphatase